MKEAIGKPTVGCKEGNVTIETEDVYIPLKNIEEVRRLVQELRVMAHYTFPYSYDWQQDHTLKGDEIIGLDELE